MTRISVALCSFNGAPFVRDQIDSILAQDRVPDEIILVDDASTDGTTEILKEYAAREPQRFRLVCNAENIGTVRNFEKAIGMTTGQIVFLSDQDDVWLPHKVSSMLPAFDRPEVLLVHSDARLVDRALEPIGPTLFEALRVSERERQLQDAGQSFLILLRRNIVTGASTAIRRELYELAGKFPESWMHDAWLGVVASVHGWVRRIDVPLVLYRQHDSNQVGMSALTLRQRFEAAFEGRHRPYLETAVLQREVLLTRLRSAATVDTVRIAETEAQLSHLRYRLALPPSRLARARAVWREWRSGRYWRYGNGMRTVAQDVLAAPDAP